MERGKNQQEKVNRWQVSCEAFPNPDLVKAAAEALT
jgi:hypothetical protein